MNPNEVKAIKYYEKWLETSMPPLHITTQLRVRRIIDIDDEDEIDAEKTTKKKNQKILGFIFNSENPDVFKCFVEALKSIPTKSNVLGSDLEKKYNELMNSS